ncbi:MAG: hypothetical protein Q4P23_04460, partial [Micrococcaceae bacterium]|nr:hypothetical protein [Micrococcaceae bacterium]
DIESERNNYAEVLGLVEVMDHGWILTLADPSGAQQISLMTRDPTAPDQSPGFHRGRGYRCRVRQCPRQGLGHRAWAPG